MGVPKFYGYWLRHQKITGLSSSYLPENIHSLYVDLNPLIHQVCQRVYAYGEFANHNPPPGGRELSRYDLVFSLLQEQINRLIQQSNVNSLVYLAVDGPAPQAKVNQQRGRRFSQVAPQPGEFDSNAISPGTALMFYLDQRLTEWLTNSETFPSLRVIYSSHAVYGEGEHKIMDHMRSLPEAPRGNVIIHGLDTDLIFLGMLAPIRHLYLWREPQDRDEQIVLNMVNLRREISSRYGHVGNFVLLMNFIGNDFLPGQTALTNFNVTIDSIEESYKRAGSPILLDRDFNINWPNFLLVVEQIKAREIEFLREKAMTNFNYPPTLLLRHFNQATGVGNFENFRETWNNEILNLRPRGLPMVPISWVCADYLVGFQWVMKYYTGRNYNYLWHYKFFRAPLLHDIVDYLAGKPRDPINNSLWRENSSYRRYTLWENLYMILPPHSRGLLPVSMQQIESAELTPLFPSQVSKIYDGVYDEWMGRPLVPIISLPRTTKILDTISSSSIPNYPQNPIVIINP